MATMSRLNVTPTGAQAYQSPFSVGAAPGLAPIDTVGFGDLLKQQMAQKMRMARLQEQMMRQQLDDAKRRASRAPGLSKSYGGGGFSKVRNPSPQEYAVQLLKSAANMRGRPTGMPATYG
jgi:hypothetical protein